MVGIAQGLCLPAGVNRVHNVDTITKRAVHWEDGVEDTRIAEERSSLGTSEVDRRLSTVQQLLLSSVREGETRSGVKAFQAVLKDPCLLG